MKFNVKHFFAGVVLAVLVGLPPMAAFAGDHGKIKRDTVTFAVDTTVNGTLLKAGDYDIRFDEQTINLSILRHGKVVAQATGQLQDRTHKAPGTELQTRDNVLVAVAFRGQIQDIVIAPGGSATGQ